MKIAGKIKKKRISFNQTLFLLVIIIVIGIGITIANERFLQSRNLLNLFKQISVTGIITMGMAMVLISGGIDLSVGSIVSLVACVGASLFVAGASVLVVVICSVATGLVCGLFNGLIIAKTKCAPFIITLGSMSIFQGVALIIAEGKIINLSGQFQTIGRGKLWFIPMPIIVFLAVFAVVFILLRFSILGRRFYAIGGNEEAAYLSGVNVVGNKLLVYILNGVVVSIAGLVLLSRLGSANPTMGSGYELNSIASAVIGGISLDGGKGTLVGCFLGILLLGLISNALNILGVSPFYQNIVLGAIIIFAVVISNIAENRKGA